ncbi:hypothetical protein [Mycobacterium simiae]|uniref:hypothetical protein n=1 Tax=Mycobacterium simiae TaxID=1784 RepID=UPI001C38143B|nr:hypothetical protein [Mycobacterium simiae]
MAKEKPVLVVANVSLHPRVVDINFSDSVQNVNLGRGWPMTILKHRGTMAALWVGWYG